MAFDGFGSNVFSTVIDNTFIILTLIQPSPKEKPHSLHSKNSFTNVRQRFLWSFVIYAEEPSYTSS